MLHALVVDDKPENLYFLEVLLKSRGYTVQAVANGAEALAAARREPPDIVVTDLLMPVMDGFSLCREWKRDDRLRHIPLVVYTATYTDASDEQLALDLGADRFLIKPLEPDEFLRAIDEVLNRPAEERPPQSGAGLPDDVYLREYNQVLVQKLEHKLQQLEETNRALADSEQRYRLLAEKTVDAIWTMTLDGKFTYVNPAITAMTGFTPEEWIGSNLADHFDDSNLAVATEAIAAETAKGPAGGSVVLELEMLRKDGTPIPIEVHGTTIFDERGAPVLVQGVGRDISERKRADQEREEIQSQLFRAQKMESVGRLAGGIAHDINNILQALLSMVSALRLDCAVPEVTRTTEEMETVIRRGACLTRQLLQFSRRKAEEKRRLELGEVVGVVTVMLRRLLPEHIRLDVETAPGLLWIDGDDGQLQQVLLNLAVNARDAMPDGGVLALRTRPLDGEASLEVEDSGHGMDAATLSHAFEPFFTTKEVGKGTGLGLAVVHRIVEEHGGRIEVESAPGEGSRFRITFPTTSEPAAGPPTQAPNSELPHGDGRTVLVVEDEESARSAVARMMERYGYRVTAVASTDLALALPPTPAFDLLLTDLVMPRSNGLELASELQRRWPRIKVVIMSGYTDEEVLRRRVDEGSVLFLQKPFGIEELAGKLRTAFETGAPS